MRFENLKPGPLRTVLCGIALMLACGCAAPSAQPLTKELAGDDPDSQIAFWHTLPSRKAVSNDEAFHALLLFVENQEPAPDYDSRVRQLKERKMLDAAFNEKAEDAVRRGTVAVALVRALSIKGGLTMRIFGPHPRYAERELEYAGVFPPSSPQQIFSGAEFLGIIGRAEDYQRVSVDGTTVLTPEKAEQSLESTPPADLGTEQAPTTQQ
jgi:hypothetical protein